MLRFLALLAILLIPSGVFAQPAPEAAPAAVSAPSSAVGPSALAASPGATTAATLTQPEALPGLPAYGLPPGFTWSPTPILPAPAMAQAPVLEVPTPPPSVAADPWWKDLLRNADNWAFLLMAVVALLKLFGVKNVDRYAKDFAEVVAIAYHATEEAGLRGEVKQGAKAQAFGPLFERLMENRGHKDLSSDARAAAQAEADALNKVARGNVVPDPTEAPSAP